MEKTFKMLLPHYLFLQECFIIFLFCTNQTKRHSGTSYESKKKKQRGKELENAKNPPLETVPPEINNN